MKDIKFGKLFSKMKSFLFVDILFIVVGLVVGIALMLMVYSIPTTNAVQNIKDSMDIIESEYDDDSIIPGYDNTLTGFFTDCIMLENAIYRKNDASKLENVMHVYRGESGSLEAWIPGQSLIDAVNGVGQDTVIDYGRYWHGYLVVLIPLLYFMSFGSIRALIYMATVILLGLVLVNIGRRRNKMQAYALVFSIPFITCMGLSVSLSLSIVFFITFLTILLLLEIEDKVKDKKTYYYIFFIVGMLVAYFDFLTYPLIAFIFPLIIILDRIEDKCKFKFIIMSGIQWFMGVSLFWACKWVASDLLTSGKIIADALTTVSQRTSKTGGSSFLAGLIAASKENIMQFAKWGYGLYCIVLIIVAIILVIIRKNINKHNVIESIVYLLLALSPFAWYAILQNHSFEHSPYTCKLLAITVYAGFMFLDSVTKKNIKDNGISRENDNEGKKAL